MRAGFRWLINNLPLMVMALILASIAWFVALEENDPTVEKRYPQPVPIGSPQLPDGMLVVGPFDERVQVTVRAPESVWDSLEPGDFSVELDLTDPEPGVHEVPVLVAVNKEPAKVVEYEPEAVTLELDSKTERSVPVSVEPEGEPALGYISRSPILDPRQAIVSGPTSYVTQVVEAHTTISVQDADADIEAELRLRAEDGDGRSVPYVDLTPEVVEVRIPVEASDNHRPLAVQVVLTGEVASGYRVRDILVEPPVIIVFGAPSVLDDLPGFIETKPIDVGGAQADVVVRPALSRPGNVSVVPGQEVEVRVDIEPIESSVTKEIEPEVQGLGPGLTATVSPETVKVLLSGPLPVLETLKPEDVRVVLDLFDLSVGTHQIEPDVITPDKVTAESVNPAALQVEIAATPTPTGQQPITATATLTATATITTGR